MKLAGALLVAGLSLLFTLNAYSVARDVRRVTRAPLHGGARAPSVAGRLADGGRFALDEERGHPVVLVFWASWCGPCMAELPAIERLGRRLSAERHPTRVFAVNTEGNPGAARAAMARLGLTVPVVLDDGTMANAFEVSSIPRTFLIDADGQVVRMWRGGVSEAALLQAIAGVELQSAAR